MTTFDRKPLSSCDQGPPTEDHRHRAQGCRFGTLGTNVVDLRSIKMEEMGIKKEAKDVESDWLVGGWPTPLKKMVHVWYMICMICVSGWWLSQPLWKIWVRQLGWWHSQYVEKQEKNPSYQPVIKTVSRFKHLCWTMVTSHPGSTKISTIKWPSSARDNDPGTQTSKTDVAIQL